jgi:RHS repeat-associated protein
MAEITTNGTIGFSWDATTPVPQMLTDDTNAYIYGPAGLPIEHVSTSGAPLYYFHDGLGSTRALLNPVGATAATYSYKPYGGLNKKTGTAATPLTYAQSDVDTATGFNYLINRYYDPTTAEFSSIDPAIASTGTAYLYAADDPLNHIDPNGLMFKLPSWVKPAHAVLSLATGGYTAIKGEATAVATCQYYGWASNACSNATWQATIGVLTLGVKTYSPIASSVIGGAAYAAKAASTAANLYYGRTTGAPDGGTSNGAGCNPVSQGTYNATQILQPASVRLQ